MLDLLDALDRRERQIARWLPTPAFRPSTDPTSSTDPSLADFIAEVAPKHTPIPWHLAQLVALLERAAHEPVRAIVCMPPRYGKSITVQRALSWVIRRWPDRLNAYLSYSGDFAKGMSRRIRRTVTRLGTRLVDDAATLADWRVARPADDADDTEPGGLCASGINGQLTGKGFTGLVVCDDLIKGREAAESQLQRDRAWETFNSDAFTRLEPGASCVLVNTRWHLDDVAGRLLEMAGGEWELLSLPAVRDPATGEASDDGVPLWPDKHSLEALRKIRAQVNEYPWASLFQQHPVPRGGKLFRTFTRYDGSPNLSGARIMLAVDPAGSASTKANRTVAVALAVRGFGDEMTADLVGLRRMQLEPGDAAPVLHAFQKRYGEPLHIEGSRDGHAQAKALRSIDSGLAIVLVPAIGDKYTRATPVSAAAAAGRFRVPARAEDADMTADDLREYLRVMARVTGIADAEDDDMDATAHGWNVARAQPKPVRQTPALIRGTGGAGW